MTTAPVTVNDIFERFGGAAKIGKIIGKPTEHAAAMKRRGSIPVTYWASLITGAPAYEVTLTERDLIQAHSAEPEAIAS